MTLSFVKISVCSHEKPGWPGYRDLGFCYRDLGNKNRDLYRRIHFRLKDDLLYLGRKTEISVTETKISHMKRFRQNSFAFAT